MGFLALTLGTIQSASHADGINGLHVGINQNTADLGTQTSSEWSNRAQLGPAKHTEQDSTLTGEEPVITELKRLKQETAQNKTNSPSEPHTKTIVEVDTDAVDLYLKNEPIIERGVLEELLLKKLRRKGRADI